MILPISCIAESSISEKSSSSPVLKPPIKSFTMLLAAFFSTRNIIMPSISSCNVRSIPTTIFSAPPISSPSSLNSKRSILGTFISIFAESICDRAVVAFPAPILPISRSTSNCIWFISSSFTSAILLHQALSVVLLTNRVPEKTRCPHKADTIYAFYRPVQKSHMRVAAFLQQPCNFR